MGLTSSAMRGREKLFAEEPDRFISSWSAPAIPHNPHASRPLHTFGIIRDRQVPLGNLGHRAGDEHPSRIEATRSGVTWIGEERLGHAVVSWTIQNEDNSFRLELCTRSYKTEAKRWRYIDMASTDGLEERSECKLTLRWIGRWPPSRWEPWSC